MMREGGEWRLSWWAAEIRRDEDGFEREDDDEGEEKIGKETEDIEEQLHQKMNISSHTTSVDLNILPEDVNSICNIVTATENMRGPNKKKNFTSETKRAVFEMLLEASRDGKIPKGSISKVANTFSISRRSVSRIWHNTKCSSSTIGEIPDFSSKLVKRVGRKRADEFLTLLSDEYLNFAKLNPRPTRPLPPELWMR
ncbi:uncharacterized protein Fot_07124 [Forsythia ovata]|uniref:DUF7769 domain-containing protein n=1 Tax=Forsythia ovata TaxID=205694 RepID=A0ABD1WZ26_9LAMI